MSETTNNTIINVCTVYDGEQYNVNHRGIRNPSTGNPIHFEPDKFKHFIRSNSKVHPPEIILSLSTVLRYYKTHYVLSLKSQLKLQPVHRSCHRINMFLNINHKLLFRLRCPFSLSRHCLLDFLIAHKHHRVLWRTSQ